MNEAMLDRLMSLLHYWDVAMAAVHGVGMTIALVLVTAILAAVGGFVSGRMRLYGAIVGGMIVNMVVKAMDGGFAAALAAMLAITVAGYMLGCTPLLLRLMKAKSAP
jgi:F0F1-type ATP synthase membrane subunit a